MSLSLDGSLYFVTQLAKNITMVVHYIGKLASVIYVYGETSSVSGFSHLSLRFRPKHDFLRSVLHSPFSRNGLWQGAENNSKRVKLRLLFISCHKKYYRVTKKSGSSAMGSWVMKSTDSGTSGLYELFCSMLSLSISICFPWKYQSRQYLLCQYSMENSS